MRLRKNEIKHYSGIESELFATLPSGDTYFCTDTNNLYKYNEDNKPYLIGGASTGVPYLITATPGGSSTYDERQNTIYSTWSGGSGTYHLTLPSASSNPYRVIRIINDGTVTANDKIHVVAPGGETIDGVAEYVLNKPYSGVQIWSDGTNWIVIQAKAH